MKINFKVKKGEILVIRGVSGSGKSTLANILLGLTKHTDGEIYIDGNKILNKFFASYVPQDVFLIDSTIKYNIVFTEQLNNRKTKVKSSY